MVETHFRNTRDFIEQLGAFLSKEGAMSAARILVGVVLGVAVGMATGNAAGIATVAAISAGVVGLTSLAHYSIQRQKQVVLLDTYHEEISHMVGAPEHQLTVGDLKSAAKSQDNPKGSTAIAMALDYFRNTRNFYVGSQIVTAGLMIAGLSVASTFDGVSVMSLAGASGLLYNELFRTVTNVGSLVFPGNIKGTITREIRAVSEQIALGGRVSSTRILGIQICADPELQKDVEAHFSQPYDTLSIAEKREAVNMYNDRTHSIQLAYDINKGRILPTELAFIAFGESSGTPLSHPVPDMHMVSDDKNLTKWAASVPKRSPLFVTPPPSEDHVTRLAIDEDSISAINHTLS